MLRTEESVKSVQSAVPCALLRGTRRIVLRCNTAYFRPSTSGCAVAQLQLDDRAARAGRSRKGTAVPRNSAFCPLETGELYLALLRVPARGNWKEIDRN